MCFYRILIGVLGVVFLTACSTPPRYLEQDRGEKNRYFSVTTFSETEVRRQLLEQFNRWKGTPYRYGGNSLNGVDCSAFVQNTYWEKFNKRIPRTTRTQIKVGKRIQKSQLRVGDIVFFKTGRNSMHNGIYIGNAQFIHASSSKGVTRSSLHNTYWRKRYLTSRRIL